MPTNDGKVIRINIPPLSEERREELIKITKKMAEDGRVSIELYVAMQMSTQRSLRKISSRQRMSSLNRTMIYRRLQINILKK